MERLDFTCITSQAIPLSIFTKFFNFKIISTMKKLSLVIILVVAFIGQNLFAQSVNSKGRIIDAKGDIHVGTTKIGSISKDSIVRDAKGKKIAFLKSGGILVDAKGKNLGKMGKDGNTFYNADGTHVLSVKENTDTQTCDIMDANGKVIGNVHNNFKPMACTLHCFVNKMDSKTHQKIKK